jgi:hypothetical protein
MTLKYTEGFDWLESADLPSAFGAFANIQPSGTMTQTIVTGRNGDGALQIVPAFDAPVANMQGKAWTTNIAADGTIIVGFSIKINTMHTTGDLGICLIKGASGNSDTIINLAVIINTTKVIQAGTVSGGNFSTAIFGGTGTTTFVTGVWYRIEIKFYSHASAGTVEVRINGVTEINLTGKDTLNGSDNANASVTLGVNYPGAVAPSVIFDDVVILDTTGSLNNNFLGDVQVKMRKPNGNGNTNQFTGSDADSTDNYLLVDDGAAPDEDTTYTEDSVSGNKDLYAYENSPSGTATIFAVNVKTLARKTTAGAADLKAVARSNVTETDSGNLGLTTSYTIKPAIYEIDPNTSAAWGTSGFDSAQFGVKVA